MKATAASILVLPALCVPAVAQMATNSAVTDYRAPRTSSGQPSLEGVWLSNSIVPVEAIPEAPDLVVAEAEAGKISDIVVRSNADLPIFYLDPEVPELFREAGRINGLNVVRGQRRTRQVVEPASGKLPLTPAARGQINRIEQIVRSSVSPPLGNAADNPEQRSLWERCVALQANPPITQAESPHPLQVIQTRHYVVLHQEYGDEARIIPFAEKHRTHSFRQPLGDSIARWEGDTLVVETINLHAQDRIRGVLVFSPRSKVIEKLTRLSEGELLYQYTIEDPAIYTAPWLAEYSFYRTDRKMYEFSCHAGNYSLPNIMRGQRMAEQRAARNP
jgi:hypothetical protein